MVCASCHEGKGIICLDENNASVRNHITCGWAKYPDITYVFRSVEISDNFSIDIPSNAIGINTDKNHVSWLESTNKTKNKK